MRVGLRTLTRMLGSLLAAAAVLLVIVSVIPPRVNPVGLTRHIIEECNDRETEIRERIMRSNLPPRIDLAFGVAFKETNYKEIKTSVGSDPLVLDAWGHPVNIVARTNLPEGDLLANSLRAKTNSIIIWSSGPNGVNEYGHGDDIVAEPYYTRPTQGDSK